MYGKSDSGGKIIVCAGRLIKPRGHRVRRNKSDIILSALIPKAGPFFVVEIYCKLTQLFFLLFRQCANITETCSL